MVARRPPVAQPPAAWSGVRSAVVGRTLPDRTPSPPNPGRSGHGPALHPPRRHPEGSLHPRRRRCPPGLAAAGSGVRGLADPRHLRGAGHERPPRGWWQPAGGAPRSGGARTWATTWTHSSEGLTYGDDGPRVTTVWNVTATRDAIYAGVEPAGLFRSVDRAHLDARGGTHRPPLPVRLGRRSRRAHPPHDRPPPHRPCTDVGRDLVRRRVRDKGRRQHVGDPEPRRPGRLPPGEVPGVRTVRPQAGPGLGRHRAPLPAEPLRRLPVGRRGPSLGRDHRGAADAVRVRDGRPPAGPEHRLDDPADRARGRPADAGRQRRGLANRTTPARPGSAPGRACRSRTPTSACCARRWRWTGSIPWASTSAPAPGRCTAAPTRAGRGPGSRTTCRRSGRWRPWSLPEAAGRAVIVHLPRSLVALFPDCPRRIEATGATVEAGHPRRRPAGARAREPCPRRRAQPPPSPERVRRRRAGRAGYARSRGRGRPRDPRGVGRLIGTIRAGRRRPLARGRPARSPGRRRGQPGSPPAVTREQVGHGVHRGTLRVGLEMGAVVAGSVGKTLQEVPQVPEPLQLPCLRCRPTRPWPGGAQAGPRGARGRTGRPRPPPPRRGPPRGAPGRPAGRPGAWPAGNRRDTPGGGPPPPGASSGSSPGRHGPLRGHAGASAGLPAAGSPPPGCRTADDPRPARPASARHRTLEPHPASRGTRRR